VNLIGIENQPLGVRKTISRTNTMLVNLAEKINLQENRIIKDESESFSSEY
jgi:hypothetical protein